MKKNIKKTVLKAAFAIYEPVITRVEKFRAAYMWKRGVRLCKAMYEEIGAPRVYLFYDTKHMVWAPMTYKSNKKHKPSLQMFRRMGKARGVSKISNEKHMMDYAFYYTASKWGAKGCDDDNTLKKEKLSLWIAYYMTHLSEPMRKCREFRRSA